jgi:hypothetical protein
MKLKFGSGKEEDYSQPYVDAMDFAEAALWDEETNQDVLDNLDALEEVAGEGTQVAGYSKEAKEIINHWRLGKNQA